MSAVTSPVPVPSPVTVAVFVYVPASISVWVTTYSAVNVVLSDAPTARDAIGPPDTVAPVSTSVISVTAILPVLVTVNA